MNQNTVRQVFHITTGQILLFILLVIVSASVAISAQEAPGSDDNKRVVALLEGYQQLITRPLEGADNDPAARTWSLVQKAIAEGYLRFSFNPVDQSIMEGARVRISPDSSTVYIDLSVPLLDTWETRPALAYTILSRCLQDAYHYFSDPSAWIVAQTDLADYFMLRMECYRAAALFARDRLGKSNLALGPYETYLVDSLETDNLASVALYLERMSLPVASRMQNLRLVYEQDEDSARLRNAVLELGEQLLTSRDELGNNPDDGILYPPAVAIHSWLELSPWMLSRIYNKGNNANPLPFDKVLEREGEYARLRRMLEARRIVDMPIVNHIYNSNIRGFEAR